MLFPFGVTICLKMPDIALVGLGRGSLYFGVLDPVTGAISVWEEPNRPVAKDVVELLALLVYHFGVPRPNP